jgi:NSS family neurotransmitter:Na+ symporter
LDKKVSIPASAGSVVVMNIFISILAGLAIFPVVFAFGFEPAQGPGLLFMVLPAVFSQIPMGEFFLAIFLLLFLFATLTSSFSMLEIIVSAFIENGKHSRKKISWISGIVVFAAGIPAALSYSLLGDFQIFGKNVFDATDFLVSNILLPLGSLLIALFISYKMSKQLVKDEFTISNTLSPAMYTTWSFLMKWVVPITIIVVFMSTLGFI